MATQNQLDDFAFNVSELSYCKRKKVGAVIVDKSGLNILSYGFNGTTPGDENCCEGEDGLTKDNVIHAEENAILKLAKLSNSSEGGTLYVTVAPCMQCARKIVSVGIENIIYKEIYSNHDHIDYFFENVRRYYGQF